MQKKGGLSTDTKFPETKNLSYEETETIETSVSSLSLNGNSVINVTVAPNVNCWKWA